MTQEEKARAYDKAIEKAKEFKNNPFAGYDGTDLISALFPELKESDDEKIRKEILSFCQNRADNYPNDPKYANIGNWIAWLEKQGEQKSADKVEPKFNIGDTIWKKTDHSNRITILSIDEYFYYANSYNILIEIADKEWELVEQKPAWSEEDEQYLNNAITACLNEYGDISDTAIWLKFLKDRVQPQPKREWNKEDEDILNTIINHFKVNVECTDDDDIIKWLKSLRPQNRWITIDKEVYVKEPVLAQKKDKSDPFNGFVVCCDHTLTPNIYERYVRLDNNCFQNKWKPSDEQMKALEKACDKHWEPDGLDPLYTLYQDLKNLREE